MSLPLTPVPAEWITRVETLKEAALAGEWNRVKQLDVEFQRELKKFIGAGNTVEPSHDSEMLRAMHNEVLSLATSNKEEVEYRLRKIKQNSTNCRQYLKNGEQ